MDKIREEFKKIFRDTDFTDENIPEFVLKAQCYEGFEACYKSRDKEVQRLHRNITIKDAEIDSRCEDYLDVKAKNKKLRDALEELITECRKLYFGEIDIYCIEKAEKALKDGE